MHSCIKLFLASLSMDSPFKRKSPVPFLQDFPVHILNRRPGSASLFNGLRLFFIRYFISFTATLSLFMFEAFRLLVMSSFFVRLKSSFRYGMSVVLKK